MTYPGAPPAQPPRPLSRTEKEALARIQEPAALPDRQSLINHDRLVLKGPGLEIYVIKASPPLLAVGHVWAGVHIVERDWLRSLPEL